MGLIGHQRADLRNVPHPGTLRSGAPSNGLAGFWLAPIGQFPVAVDGVVAAPLQLVADRGFTGAGNAVDDVVLGTHVSFPIRQSMLPNDWAFSCRARAGWAAAVQCIVDDYPLLIAGSSGLAVRSLSSI